MGKTMTIINAIKSRLAALFSSFSAMVGACGSICGSTCLGTCVTGPCGGLALPLFGFFGLIKLCVALFRGIKAVIPIDYNYEFSLCFLQSIQTEANRIHRCTMRRFHFLLWHGERNVYPIKIISVGDNRSMRSYVVIPINR
ncbi:MAG: hypothetical protein KKB51_06195 [Candidatus Riflebacteria bacterium]|nr:hypothetical protein [Candidatus Riflebacteria bacterium]